MSPAPSGAPRRRSTRPAAGPSFRERILAPGAFLTVVELVPWRGTAQAPEGRTAMALAAALAEDPRIDAVSVTDNAGGHAMAGPELMAREAVGRGGRAIVHVACRDRNRNELLSVGWRLASEGLDTILCLSGDYPVEGIGGVARPVFDVDSVALLELYGRAGLLMGPDGGDGLFPGAVVNNHKRLEAEVMPQYHKLERKIRSGARYVISQVGWDARKQDELLRYLAHRGLDVPVLANVFLLTRGIARTFHAGKIPGVTVSDSAIEARLPSISCPRDPGKSSTSGAASSRRRGTASSSSSKNGCPTYVLRIPWAVNQSCSKGSAESTWSTSRRIFLIRQLAQAQICGGQ